MIRQGGAKMAKRRHGRRVQVIFVKNGWRYTAYLNALLELPARRSLYVPGVLEMGWEHFRFVRLRGNVGMAIKMPWPPEGGWARATNKQRNLIIAGIPGLSNKFGGRHGNKDQ